MIFPFVRLLLLVAVYGGSVGAWAANLNAWLDRTRIAEGESVQLTLEAPGQVSDRPDTTPLEADFDVLGVSTGSHMSIVNGRTDARTNWQLTLSPKRGGKLTIPALRVANYQSTPLILEVSRTPPAGKDADILLETELMPSAPYVQAQVLYTIRLLHAVPISGGRLDEPKPANTLVQRLGDDRKYVTTRNGRRYQVIERRYALFPQRSGALELVAPVFNGEVPDRARGRSSPLKGFFGTDPFFGQDPFAGLMAQTRRVRVRGEPAALEVRPRPDGVQGAYWLPAERLTLSGEWQPDASDIHVGEPVTLELKVSAQGLTGGQLSSLAPQAVPGFNVYPDQEQPHTDVQESGVTGRLVQKVAFIAKRAGELAVPPIQVDWWDTQADEKRFAMIPGRIIKVLPAAGQAAPEAPPLDPASTTGNAAVAPAAPLAAAPKSETEVAPLRGASWSGPWPWISAVFATGWLFTAALWWWRARGERPPELEGQARASISARAASARQQFLAACKSADAKAARRRLLAWTAAHWPHDPPRGLEDLAQRLPDPSARQAIDDLNRALYRDDSPWSGKWLAQQMRQLPKQDAAVDSNEPVLPPLYPRSGQRYST